MRKAAIPGLPTRTRSLHPRYPTLQPDNNSTSNSAEDVTTGPQATIVNHPDVARIQSWRNDFSLKASLARKYRTYTPAPVPTGACILWDPKCNTNLRKPQAAELFWGLHGMDSLQDDACFADDNSTFTCQSSALVPMSASVSAAVKSYMLNSRCSSDLRWFQENYATDLDGVYQVMLSAANTTQYVDWQWGERETVPPGITEVLRTESDIHTSCCGQCNIYADTVKVYYWPQPGSDDSCFSIIGDKIKPELDDATTNRYGQVFWGTTTTAAYDGDVGILTTATLGTIGGVTFKRPIVDPWSLGISSPLVTGRPLSSSPIMSNHKGSAILLSSKSAHVLALTGNLVQGNSSHGNIASLASTFVSEGFTFSSPSVYVALNLKLRDRCGFKGMGTVSSTILAFRTDELSTVEFGSAGYLGGPHGALPTKVFNFTDLPCPPQSVMEANWYSPAPGYPWRPRIAIPEKLLSLDPSWHTCTPPAFFTGLDPPRTLQAASAMADPGQAIPSLPRQTDPPQKSSPCKDCVDPGKPPTVGSPSKSDPPTAQNPSQIDQGRFDPNALNDEQMSSLHVALSPGTKDGNTAVQGDVPDDVRLPQTRAQEEYASLGDPPPQNPGQPQQDPGSSSEIQAPSHFGEDSNQPDVNVVGQDQPLVVQPDAGGGSVKEDQISGQMGKQPLPAGGPSPTIFVPTNSANTPVVGNSPPALSTTNVAGQVLTQAPSRNGFDIQDTTILPGSPALKISQTPYSLAPSASALIIGSSTIALATRPPDANDFNPLPILTAGTKTFTPLGPSAAEISGSTISINGPAITDSEGTILSLGYSGLAVGSSTYTFPTPGLSPSPLRNAATSQVASNPIVTAGHTFNFQAPDAVALTLTAGQPGITVGSMIVSVGSGGLVIGSETITFPTASGEQTSAVDSDDAPSTAGGEYTRTKVTSTTIEPTVRSAFGEEPTITSAMSTVTEPTIRSNTALLTSSTGGASTTNDIADNASAGWSLRIDRQLMQAIAGALWLIVYSRI